MQEIKHIRPTFFEQNLADDLENFIIGNNTGVYLLLEDNIRMRNQKQPTSLNQSCVRNLISRAQNCRKVIWSSENPDQIDVFIGENRWEIEILNNATVFFKKTKVA